MRKTMFGAVVALAAAPAVADVTLDRLGTYTTGVFDEGAAEIAAYDVSTQRLFVVNSDAATVDVLDISNPESPSLDATIDAGADAGLGGGANSVAVKNGILAVAVENDPSQADGAVAFYDTGTLDFIAAKTVGALPDMVTFTPDGGTVLVANEGEPNDDYTWDPEGSVSIIDISRGVMDATVRTADFSRFNKDADKLRANGVRIFGPGATVAQDLEPEYIVTAEGQPKAWAMLQENNAVAEINLRSAKVTRIIPLGFKDHSLAENKLDASDRDERINIANWPVFGMYQPDGAAYFTDGGQRFIVTANEGDAREYIVEIGDDEIDIFVEEERVDDLVLDPVAFPNAADLQLEENLGRLTVTTTLGDTDGDGEYEALYAFGARSFTIWRADNFQPIFDSGSDFEDITANLAPAYFNFSNDDNDPDEFDSRSDAKGPEPEGVVVGEAYGKRLAFIGLERIGGVMVYDITDPYAPVFQSWVNNRDFTADAEDAVEAFSETMDLGPEGLVFIPAADSPNGKPLLVVSNEVSGTTSIFEVVTAP
ncbi:MAG: choice-of-anchor I family protein [Gammaproteobacteria bacterium]